MWNGACFYSKILHQIIIMPLYCYYASTLVCGAFVDTSQVFFSGNWGVFGAVAAA